MTIADYRAHPAQNYSALKHILVSPAHYLAALRSKTEETVAMRLGTMLHAWWLEEKEDVLGDAVVRPEGIDGRTKEGKEWLANNSGKLVLTQDDWAQFLRRQTALKESKIAADLLSVCSKRETPLFGEINGVPVKALFDAHYDCGFLDLKTCQKNDPKTWGETVIQRAYDFQAALYAEVWRQNHEGEPFFWWVTVSDDATPVVAVYEREPFAALGDDKLREAIAAYKVLIRHGEQPMNAELPFWARPK
jgi:hypothetical protein